MYFEWICTGLHGFLTLSLVIGVLFSKSIVQMVSIVSCLLIILCMIRLNDGCFLTQYEKGDEKVTLTDMGLAFSIKDTTKVMPKHFEEIVVSNLLLIQLIRMLSLSILPIEMMFETTYEYERTDCVE